MIKETQGQTRSSPESNTQFRIAKLQFTHELIPNRLITLFLLNCAEITQLL